MSSHDPRHGFASRALAVGVTWRDIAAGLCEIGRRRDGADIAWAATSAVDASVLAPHPATVAIREVYVARATVVEIESAAERVRAQPSAG